MDARLPRAVLVDLDGTLVDTAPDIAEAVNRMLDERGAPPLALDAIRGFIGNGVPTLLRRVLHVRSDAGLDEASALELFGRHYLDTNGRYGQVFPGVRAGLEALRQGGCRLGCVTNKYHAPTAALLDIHGLARWFDAVVAGDALAQMKPSAAPLLHACRLLGASPGGALLVGDSGVDVAAARAARMPVYIVRYGYPGADAHRLLECDAFIDGLDELPALLAARYGARTGAVQSPAS